MSARPSTYGVESFVAYKPWERLTLRGDYTFTIAKDDILDEPLVRRPKHKASLNATWQVTERRRACRRRCSMSDRGTM